MLDGMLELPVHLQKATHHGIVRGRNRMRSSGHNDRDVSRDDANHKSYR
jgi:hypothetical protein